MKQHSVQPTESHSSVNGHELWKEDLISVNKTMNTTCPHMSTSFLIKMIVSQLTLAERTMLIFFSLPCLSHSGRQPMWKWIDAIKVTFYFPICQNNNIIIFHWKCQVCFVSDHMQHYVMEVHSSATVTTPKRDVTGSSVGVRLVPVCANIGRDNLFFRNIGRDMSISSKPTVLASNPALFHLLLRLLVQQVGLGDRSRPWSYITLHLSSAHWQMQVV